MKQSLGLISLVVRDYDEALNFYCETLGFELVEDIYQPEQDKRWVVVRPPGVGGSHLLLAQASNEDQETRIGNQTGGRVFLFLYTDDFWRDYDNYQSKGVNFVREPKTEGYGTVAVFEDLYGTRWDLIQPSDADYSAIRLLEESLFEPAVRQDAEQLDAVLHDEFTEIGMSGRRYDKRSIMNLLHDSTKTTFQAIGQNYQFIELADGLVQLMYESANLEEGGELVNHARRTSIWQNESGHWKIKYHQGTATEPFERSK